MAPPSPLVIATSSVTRLLKEEASYHKEVADQEAQIKKLEEKIKSGQVSEDGNDEFMLKQRKTALEQTKAVFGPLGLRIEDAVAKLEDQIALGEGTEPETELVKAREVLAKAKAELAGSS